MGVRLRPAVVAAAVAVGVAAPVAHADLRAAEVAPRPTVVVAIADSGVNPYHGDFYRPANTAHPCTWVTGFTDCAVPALQLSVGKGLTYPEAVAADRRIWASARPGTWYWIPRTNIIGAVCDDERGETGSTDPTCILDDNGHGTHTASSVLSEAPGALLVIHDGTATARRLATAPVVADVQSHSWGFPVPVPDQAAAAGSACPVEMYRRRESLYFQAAGNEAPLPAIADCRLQRGDVQIVGGGYPGYWTAQSWSTFDFASWFCRPAARHDRHEGHEIACGTSFSAPTAAGAAASALLRIRERDGYAGRNTAARVSSSTTRERFVRALRDAASYTPKAKYPTPCPGTQPSCAWWVQQGATWAPLPPQAPYAFWGYGWLDSTVVDAVVACARGGGCPGKTAEAARFNDARQAARHELGLPAVRPQDQSDAGSDRDAGEDTATAVPVEPGRSHEGRLGGQLDVGDGYSFRAEAGQLLSVDAAAALAPAAAASCWYVLDPDGERVGTSVAGQHVSCVPAGAPPADLRLGKTGTYTVVYRGYVPHDYRFAVRLAR